MARIEVSLDPELKLEAQAYAHAKGYASASDLARVALVNLMARNRLTEAQQANADKTTRQTAGGGLRTSAQGLQGQSTGGLSCWKTASRAEAGLKGHGCVLRIECGNPC